MVSFRFRWSDNRHYTPFRFDNQSICLREDSICVISRFRVMVQRESANRTYTRPQQAKHRGRRGIQQVMREPLADRVPSNPLPGHIRMALVCISSQHSRGMHP